MKLANFPRRPKLGDIKRWGRRVVANGLRIACARFHRIGPPAGLFSALEALQTKSSRLISDGEILADSQFSPQAPSDSIIARSGLKQDREQPHPVFWCRMDRVRLVGAGPVPLDEGKRACVEALTNVAFAKASADYNYFALPKPTFLPGNWTSLDDPCFGSGGFYHWMHDCLPKLALVDRFPKDTLILLSNPEVPFKRDLLKFLGIWERIRPLETRHYVAEHYYMAPAMAVTGCYNPLGANYLREITLPKLPPPPAGAPERIFVTRRCAWRGVANLEEVEKFFSDRGWGIFDAGEHDILEQIRTFASAREICGVHGAALANLLWCQSGAIMTELFPQPYLNGCYEVLANTIGLKYSAMIFPSARQCQMVVDLKALERRLDAARPH